MTCIPVLYILAYYSQSRNVSFFHLQSGNGSTGAQQHVGDGDDVVDQAQDDPDNVSNLAVSDADNFQQCMRFGDSEFTSNTQDSEEYNHRRASIQLLVCDARLLHISSNAYPAANQKGPATPKL